MSIEYKQNIAKIKKRIEDSREFVQLNVDQAHLKIV